MRLSSILWNLCLTHWNKPISRVALHMYLSSSYKMEGNYPSGVLSQSFHINWIRRAYCPKWATLSPFLHIKSLCWHYKNRAILTYVDFLRVARLFLFCYIHNPSYLGTSKCQKAWLASNKALSKMSIFNDALSFFGIRQLLIWSFLEWTILYMLLSRKFTF